MRRHEYERVLRKLQVLEVYGYHYYECTNEASECNGQSMSRGETCNKFEEE